VLNYLCRQLDDAARKTLEYPFDDASISLSRQVTKSLNKFDELVMQLVGYGAKPIEPAKRHLAQAIAMLQAGDKMGAQREIYQARDLLHTLDKALTRAFA